jgi:FkbH-like protein
MNGTHAMGVAQMNWLPTIENFRQALREAVAIKPNEHRLERLACLAGHRLGFLEIHQLDRALGQTDHGIPSSFAYLRLAIIGSATLNHLIPGVRVAGLRYRCLFDVHVGGYGQFRHEVFDFASSLHQFAPRLVLLSITARDILGEVPLSASEAEAEAVLTRAVDDLLEIWQSIRVSLKASVIQQTFLDLSPPIFGSLDRLVPGAPARLVLRLNDMIAAAAKEHGVMLLDIAGQVQREGLDTWFDVRHWLQAKQEIAPEAASMYGELVARIIAAQSGATRKCLVLDLDNTLWGGVIGDDGIEGLVLGPGSAEGEAFAALQHYAKQLKERGIILAICSKNEAAVAEAAFREHPEMILKRSDITAFVANWDDKAENLKRIATMLNIGIDSLVFVDDNPVERARVRGALPMVAVPEMPEDPSYYIRTIASAGYFESLTFTREDRERSDLYAKDAERDAILRESRSLEDFLSGLELSVTYSPFAKNDLERVTQLINKTNQFNTTTRRYTADEIATIAATSEYITLQFRLADRLGDNGIVSTMIFASKPEEPGALELENWVMSCRVFGRELEYEAMNIAVELALQRNARAIFADYLPTPKNTVIKNLYAGLGFSPAGSTNGANGATRWQLYLANYAPRRTHISRRISS